MTTGRVHSHRALALVERLQRLLAERQQLLMQEEDDRLPMARPSHRGARLAELSVETADVLDALAVLIPPECPGQFSRSSSVA